MTPANRDIDFPVSHTFGAYFDYEPEPPYHGRQAASEGEARLWQALEDYRRHVNNLEQRINGQQIEIDRLKLVLDRMTGKPQHAPMKMSTAKGEEQEKPKHDPRGGIW